MIERKYIDLAFSILYLLASTLFVVGSILFFPAFGQYNDIGVWCYIIGCVFFSILGFIETSEAH